MATPGNALARMVLVGVLMISTLEVGPLVFQVRQGVGSPASGGAPNIPRAVARKYETIRVVINLS
jgi:hypothetical protein